MTSRIENRRHPVVRRLRALARDGQERLREGAVLLEGVKLVEEALGAGLRLREALVSPALLAGERGRALLEGIRRAGVEPLPCAEEVLGWAASTETPQGVLVSADRPATGPLPLERGVLVVVLAGIQDPGNVGAIARTAEGAGAAGLFLLPGCAEPWGPKALRAAAGSLFRLPVEGTEWEALRRRLREAGLRIVGADPTGGPSHIEVDWRGGSAAVLGSEGTGLPEEVRRSLDAVVRIPARRVESLNVAAAAAVLLFEAARQRGFPGA